MLGRRRGYHGGMPGTTPARPAHRRAGAGRPSFRIFPHAETPGTARLASAARDGI
jgi:hypothetical protein